MPRSNHPLARLLQSTFHDDSRETESVDWENIDWDVAGFVETRRQARSKQGRKIPLPVTDWDEPTPWWSGEDPLSLDSDRKR